MPDASTGVFRMRLSDRNITPGWKPHWPFALPHGWECLYILPLSHVCSLYAVILPVNTHIKWQGSTWEKYSFKYMDYRLAQSLYMGSCAVIYRIFFFPLISVPASFATATECVHIDYAWFFLLVDIASGKLHGSSMSPHRRHWWRDVILVNRDNEQCYRRYFWPCFSFAKASACIKPHIQTLTTMHGNLLLHYNDCT